MAKENVSLELRLKKEDEAINYLLEEIKLNELMSEEHKKNCRPYITASVLYEHTVKTDE